MEVAVPIPAELVAVSFSALPRLSAALSLKAGAVIKRDIKNLGYSAKEEKNALIKKVRLNSSLRLEIKFPFLVVQLRKEKKVFLPLLPSSLLKLEFLYLRFP